MLNVLRNLDWSVLTNALLSVIPALICITLHECAHGYTALALGDTTARDMGRLSLNPLKHFDILGFLMMAFAGFGWAKPVPIDMRRFKNPKAGMAVTAIAGPLANLIIAAVSLFFYGLLFPALYESRWGTYALAIIARTAVLSVSLAVFNILPIPPLDGSKVLFSFLSERSYWRLMRYERYGMLLLIVLVVSGALDKTLGVLAGGAMDKLNFLVRWGSGLGNKLFL